MPFAELINGLLVSLLTQGAKKIQGIPVSEGQLGRIRFVAIILSAVAALVTAWIHGDLASSEYLQLVANWLSTWLYSILMYHGLVKGSLASTHPSE